MWALNFDGRGRDSGVLLTTFLIWCLRLGMRMEAPTLEPDPYGVNHQSPFIYVCCVCCGYVFLERGSEEGSLLFYAVVREMRRSRECDQRTGFCKRGLGGGCGGGVGFIYILYDY